MAAKSVQVSIHIFDVLLYMICRKLKYHNPWVDQTIHSYKSSAASTTASLVVF